jgi:hypothetical protein
MEETLEKYVGKIATIFTGGLTIKIKILDVKNTYGRDRYLITPVEGSGTVWVEKVTIL